MFCILSCSRNPIQLFRRVVESIQVYAAGGIVRAGEHGCAETRGNDRKPDRRAETADRRRRSRAGQRVHRRRLHRQPHGSPGSARAAEGFEGRRLRRDLFPRGRPYCPRRDLPDDHHRRDAALQERDRHQRPALHRQVGEQVHHDGAWRGGRTRARENHRTHDARQAAPAAAGRDGKRRRRSFRVSIHATLAERAARAGAQRAGGGGGALAVRDLCRGRHLALAREIARTPRRAHAVRQGAVGLCANPRHDEKSDLRRHALFQPQNGSQRRCAAKAGQDDPARSLGVDRHCRAAAW